MERKEIFNGLFITSDYCVWYEPRETIILADFHLGLEASLKDDGVSLPRFQKGEILDRLSTIIDKYEPRTVIVNGDFKHEFGKNRKEEFYEVMDVMDYIVENSTLLVVRGNHDNFLKTITEKKGVTMYEKKMSLDKITLSHGHEKTEHDGLLIVGHEHPSLKIRDEMGAVVKIPCYLYSEEEEVLVLPAFSPLSEGRDMIRAGKFISDGLNDWI